MVLGYASGVVGLDGVEDGAQLLREQLEVGNHELTLQRTLYQVRTCIYTQQHAHMRMTIRRCERVGEEFVSGYMVE